MGWHWNINPKESQIQGEIEPVKGSSPWTSNKDSPLRSWSRQWCSPREKEGL